MCKGPWSPFRSIKPLQVIPKRMCAENNFFGYVWKLGRINLLLLQSLPVSHTENTADSHTSL